ncbi:putative Asparagine synthase (glutamine-hydrolyzing) [Mesorhizobium prunaredense]|uniref:asparagine synthase (glutamine-hydrolyzing) n=1 Tax=Mesorhizobium prunaredense TaxID=1631249 RepID=A0A1R3VE50_9HYPH|nr:asparagine synthase-related protein [Mesorhizobium prunaredense]SIT58168.1 putative Asparagine synthase (glutamine-hydrolyzing) [Mesorhizobium prunaredense]
MAGIAGIAHWGSRPAPRDLVEGMLEVIRHRGPDGLFAGARKNIAFGHAQLILSERERNKTQPIWLPDGSCGLVADARLYNHAELWRALGSVSWFRDTPSDAELLLAAYQRWGEQAVLKLRGDFAFAVWDERKGRLFAARDPFGVKPFFYHTDSDGIRFGSEPKQLLRLPGVTAEPHDGVIADYLYRGVHRAFEETFFLGVNRLRAGHFLIAANDRLYQERFWPASAPPEDFRGSAGECAEQFYFLFRESVRRRLDMDALAAMELSGGYDSSAVVLAAADIFKSRAPSSPRPVTISQTYPEFACDESVYSDAVAAQTGFEHLRAVAPCENFAPGLLRELQKIDAPTPEIYWQRRSELTALLRNRNCKVVLTGQGGDDLVWDPDYELDLWRSRRYLSAIRYCLYDPRVIREKATRSGLKRLVRQSISPSVIRILQRGREKPVREIFDWINVGLLEKHQSYLDRTAFAGEKPVYADLARDSISNWLAEPGFLRGIEQEECLSAHAGVELRHPFLDQNLAEFVLSVPFETRLQLPPSLKAILVAALGHRLPEEVRRRASKAAFDDYFITLLTKGQPALLNMVSDTTWLASERYVKLQCAAKQWDRPLAANSRWFANARGVWQPVFLEIWLQNLGNATRTF